MFEAYTEYVDTAQSGMIIYIEHNLNTLIPAAFIFEPVGLNDYKSVSLYDSRIASLESRGTNVSQVSFNGTFKGYIQFVNLKNSRVTLEERVSSLESTVESSVYQQKQLVSGSQWRQMNSLVDKEFSDLKKTISDLEQKVKSLTSSVAAL